MSFRGHGPGTPEIALGAQQIATPWSGRAQRWVIRASTLQTLKLLVYQQLAQAVAERRLASRIHSLVNEDPDGAVVLAGRLDLDRIWPLIPKAAGMTYSVPGPPEMLDAYPYGLLSRRIDSTRVVMDARE